MSFDLRRAVDEAPAGAVVDVPAGTWAGGLTLTRAVTLRGHGAARFDGLGRGPIITVSCAGEGVVRLEGFSFTNAVAMAGAGVMLHEGKLALADCRFERCVAPTHGGGAVYARGQSLLVERCVFSQNTGRQGGALLLDQLVVGEVRDSLFAGNTAVRGGAVRVKEGARVMLDGCTLVENRSVLEPPAAATLDLAGTATRTPRLEVRHCVWVGSTPSELGRSELFPGEVQLTSNALPPSLADAAPGSGNHFDALTLTDDFRLREGMWAATAAPPEAFRGRTDVEGSARGRALGALNLVKGS